MLGRVHTPSHLGMGGHIRSRTCTDPTDVEHESLSWVYEWVHDWEDEWVVGWVDICSVSQRGSSNLPRMVSNAPLLILTLLV